MRNFPLLPLTLLLLVSLSLSGCELIVGIFEAGFWVGIILAILIILLIVWLVRKSRNK